MLGLELVMMGGLLELAASGGGCAKQKVPTILSEPLVKTARYDFTKSRDALQGFDIDTVSPYGPSHHAKIGGLMSGEIRVESRIRFMQEKYPARGRGCVHIDNVDLIIHVSPTIYVASEYKQGTCQHRAIVEHERQHVDIDVKIAKKHAVELKSMLGAHLRSAGHSFGPFPLETLPQVQERIQGQIHAMIEATNKSMTRDRMAQQQALDSLDEYERVAAQCREGLTLPPGPESRLGEPRKRVSERRHFNN